MQQPNRYKNRQYSPTTSMDSIRKPEPIPLFPPFTCPKVIPRFFKGPFSAGWTEDNTV